MVEPGMVPSGLKNLKGRHKRFTTSMSCVGRTLRLILETIDEGLCAPTTVPSANLYDTTNFWAGS